MGAGGGHFQSNTADFGNFKQGFLIMKLIQNADFRGGGGAKAAWNFFQYIFLSKFCFFLFKCLWFHVGHPNSNCNVASFFQMKSRCGNFDVCCVQILKAVNQLVNRKALTKAYVYCCVIIPIPY